MMDERVLSTNPFQLENGNRSYLPKLKTKRVLESEEEGMFKYLKSCDYQTYEDYLAKTVPILDTPPESIPAHIRSLYSDVNALVSTTIPTSDSQADNKAVSDEKAVIPRAKPVSILQPMINRSGSSVLRKQRQSASSETRLKLAVQMVSSYFQRLGPVLATARRSLPFGYHLQSIKGNLDTTTDYFKMVLCLRDTGFKLDQATKLTEQSCSEDTGEDINFTLISTYMRCAKTDFNNDSIIQEDGSFLNPASQPTATIRRNRRKKCVALPTYTPDLLKAVDVISPYFDSFPTRLAILPKGFRVTTINGDIAEGQLHNYTFQINVHDSSINYTHQLKFHVPV